MKFYLAPLEGITGYVYRNTLETCFPGMDRYFTPFLAPGQKGNFSHREQEDVAPEHNRGLDVVPQILTNRAEDFLRTAEKLKELGYTEVNLNLGCPSRTVVTKYRGSGFLAKPEELDHFLEEVFARCPTGISIKTRIGKEDRKEWSRILEIYRKYPLTELIVHPRIQEDFYKNKPDWGAFSLALADAPWPVCYNGDIVTAEDYKRLTEVFPGLERVMAGRGVLRNPGLVSRIRDGVMPKKEQIHRFHSMLYEGYLETIPGARNVLFKMKEIWVYLHQLFEDSEKYAKRIRKAEKFPAYEDAVAALFAECRLRQE